MDLDAMLFEQEEVFEPLRLIGVVPLLEVSSVMGRCTLSGVDPELTGLDLLLSLTGLRCTVVDKLLACTAFIG